MNLLDYNTDYTPNGKHLTLKDREALEIYWAMFEPIIRRKKYKLSKFKEFAAAKLTKSVRTISRELKRGMVEILNTDLTKRNVYSAPAAQKDYRDKSSAKGNNLKIGKNIKLAEFLVELLIYKKYKPGAALKAAQNAGFDVNLCERTLYNYIESGLIEGEVKRYRSRGKARKKGKTRAPLGKSIEDRPEYIDERGEFGHWEMDTVIGARKKGKVLLVLTERKTTLEYIELIDGKSTKDVETGLKRLLKRIGKKKKTTIKSITTDNGTEFKDFKSTEKLLECLQYYCHPYASGERGTNENQNKLIRRFLPKGTSFNGLTKKFVQYIEDWMNNYPRKSKNYLTPMELSMLES